MCGKHLIPDTPATSSAEGPRTIFGGFPRQPICTVPVLSAYAYQEASWLVPARSLAQARGRGRTARRSYLGLRQCRSARAVYLASKNPIMGIPFTDLHGAGNVEGWRTNVGLFLEAIIRGRSRRWTTGSVMMRDAVSISTSFDGRTALFVLTAREPGNRGRCPMDCCGVGVVTGVHP